MENETLSAPEVPTSDIPTTEPATTEPTLTKKEIIRGATNSPDLSEDEFELGGRTFKLVDLDYDDYIEFCVMFEPVLRGVFGTLASKGGVTIPGIQITPDVGMFASSMLKFCKKDLPAMVVMVCNASAKAAKKPQDFVDVDFAKSNAKTPFQLAAIVMKQAVHNNIIGEFASFFAPFLPVLRGMVGSQ